MAEEKHAKNRLRVCFGCFEKVKPGEDVFSCTDAVRERIKLKVPSYDFDDSRVPVGFCEGCKRKLKDVEKGTLKELDLSNLNSYLATQPKSSRVKCAKPCKVCSVAEKIGLDSRSQGNGNKRKGEGHRPTQPRKLLIAAESVFRQRNVASHMIAVRHQNSATS